MLNNELDNSRDPVECLAEEYTDRKRRGESPTIDEYAQKYPELSDRIRFLFPVLTILETEPQKSVENQLPHLGDFQVLREIGRGGMGIVYEALQISLGRHVAVKMLPLYAEEADRNRFIREARLASRLHHSNIVSVYGVGAREDRHFFVMQLIEGISFDRILRQLKLSQTALGKVSTLNARAEASTDVSQPKAFPKPITPNIPIPLSSQAEEWATFNCVERCQAVAKIGTQIADSLAYSHSRGVVHRDVKPSNILLDKSGHPWLSDFGLARGEESDLTNTGQVVGTLRYLAPERLHGLSGPAGDIFSLGATLYEMITLQQLRPGSGHAELMKQIQHDEPVPLTKHNRLIPSDLNTIIMKCLVKDPSQRYSSAADLANDLKRFLNDEPILARSPSLLYKFSKLVKKNQGAFIAVGLVLLSLIGGVIGTSIGMFRANIALNQVETEKEQKNQAFTKLELEQLATQKALNLERKTRQHAVTSLRSHTESLLRNKLQRSNVITELDRDNIREIKKMYQVFAEFHEEDDVESKVLVVEAYWKLGDISRTLGEFEEARTSLSEADKLMTKLKEQLSATQWHSSMAQIDWVRSMLEMEAEVYATAKTYAESSLAHWNQKSDAERTAASGLQEKVKILLTLAQIHQQSDQFSLSLPLYTEAEVICQSLSSSNPNETDWGEKLATAYVGLGQAYSKVGQLQESNTAFQKGIEMQRAIYKKNPSVSVHEILGTMLSKYAQFLKEQKRSIEAIPIYQEVLTIRRQLASVMPSVVGFQTDVALSLELLGLCFNDATEYKEAQTAFTESIELRTNLVRKFPLLPTNGLSLGGSYCNLGNTQKYLKQWTASLESYQKGIDAIHAYMDTGTRTATATQFLRNCHHGRGDSYLQLGQFEKSLEDWNKAIELDAKPLVPYFRQSLCIAYIDPSRLEEYIAKLPVTEMKTTAGKYEVAMFYAVASGSDAARKEIWAKKSMEALKEIAATGHFKNKTRLDAFLRNAHWKPLHQREDYLAFVQELKKP